MNPTNIPYLDFTYNPMHGCTPRFIGCQNCWAMAMSKRLAGMGVPGYDKADPFKVVCDESRLTEPLKRKKGARIGVSFMGDLFHAAVPGGFLTKVWDTIAECPQHTFLVLTKRPGNAREFLDFAFDSELWPYPNVHLGTSASTQADLDRNVPELLRCPAALRWLSLEPLIEEVDLALWIGGLKENFDVARFDMEPHCARCGECLDEDHECPPGFGPRPDWVVVGCESGPGRRECKIPWVKSIVNQCDDAGVPCYVKQLDYRDRVVYPGDPNWPTWAKQEIP